jgi:hypothetical protein
MQKRRQREAQITISHLERDAARTMAMQKSDELPEAAYIYCFCLGFSHLGMPTWSAGYLHLVMAYDKNANYLSR